MICHSITVVYLKQKLYNVAHVRHDVSPFQFQSAFLFYPNFTQSLSKRQYADVPFYLLKAYVYTVSVQYIRIKIQITINAVDFNGFITCDELLLQIDTT